MIAVTLTMFHQIASANEKTYKASDARLALRMSSGFEPADPEYDIDGDGAVTAKDARAILRKAARLGDDDRKTTHTPLVVTAQIITAPTTETPTTTTPTTAQTTVPTTEKQYYQIGVLSTCGLSESQLANGLRKTLKKYAWAFLEAERQYNVNAVFLSAVAALESGWGESSVARNRNNFFGWKGKGGYKHFDSPADGIMYVAKHLRNSYLTPGGGCFRGYEIEDIARCYCPGGNWASAVRGLMRMIENGAK